MTLDKRLNNFLVESVRMAWIARYRIRPSYKWCQSLLSLAIAKDVAPYVVVARFPEQIPSHGPYPYLGWLRSNKAEARECLILKDDEENFHGWLSRQSIPQYQSPTVGQRGAASLSDILLKQNPAITQGAGSAITR